MVSSRDERGSVGSIPVFRQRRSDQRSGRKIELLSLCRCWSCFWFVESIFIHFRSLTSAWNLTGCVGAVLASPLYLVISIQYFRTNNRILYIISWKCWVYTSDSCFILMIVSFLQVKTHLQAQAVQQIAVGHQHRHKSMSHALKSIYKDSGVVGLWRGVSGAIPRVLLFLQTFKAVKSVTRKLWPEISLVKRRRIYAFGKSKILG